MREAKSRWLSPEAACLRRRKTRRMEEVRATEAE